MPSIRIHDWTKEKLEAVREEESHSSFDSVIKALLRDRKLAQATELTGGAAQPNLPEESINSDKQFEDLTALAELTAAEEGVMFLWCPNCGNEVTHIVTDNPISMSVFEIQCQQCLSELNHHAIVTVEIGYPVEEKVVENELQSDLQACIIDYWDRTLAQIGNGTVDADVDDEYLVWQFFQYYQTFDWEWPVDVATVGLKSGETYVNRSRDEYVEVIDAVDGHQRELGTFRVESWSEEVDRSDATEQVLDPDEIRHLLCNRELYRVDD